MRPIIGITADISDHRYRVRTNYGLYVAKAGGIPVVLPPILGEEDRYIDLCDGFIFTGGDDPRMEQWGIETHPKATLCNPIRQEFETTLLGKLTHAPNKPVFGICLGMQWMGLLGEGTLTQDLPPSLSKRHTSGTHAIQGEFGEGVVHSSHHQAMNDSGSLVVVAQAEDGIIEAIRDPNHHWYVGVQWHPERTEAYQLGQGLFDQFCKAARQ
ncbi:MAG: gamma-glutamyl-gamma-aminobutyrate hydrolase family protein [Phycisphaerales bacterium]|jgi:putative glutamine amidotransferase|nr:gamma-glutamyl-gamma-aminobutyrate hydrolase family protein [Phycisphaerales bacterium]